MKIVTEYEVEGSWTDLSKKDRSRCRSCGSILEAVPQEGHFNSQYHYLKRDDGLDLVCCPKGCSDDEATTKMREFLKIIHWCTGNSHSYKWMLDYSKIFHCWIDRKGTIYPVSAMGHIAFCQDRGTTQWKLESEGWVKMSTLEIFYDGRKSPTQKQIDSLFRFVEFNPGFLDDYNRFLQDCEDLRWDQ